MVTSLASLNVIEDSAVPLKHDVPNDVIVDGTVMELKLALSKALEPSDVSPEGSVIEPVTMALLKALFPMAINPTGRTRLDFITADWNALADMDVTLWSWIELIAANLNADSPMVSEYTLTVVSFVWCLCCILGKLLFPRW